MIKVILVDDHQLVLDGMTAILAQVEDIELIETARSGTEALAKIKQTPPDVVVLDVAMEPMSGIDVAKQLKKDHPEIKTLALTMYDKDHFIKEMIGVGVNGYILKERGREELEKGIRAVYAGEPYYSQKVMTTVMKGLGGKNEMEGTPLTKREKEVLRLIAQGKTTPEMAEMLFVAESTVETHRRNIIDKVGVRNSLELVGYAYRNGFVED